MERSTNFSSASDDFEFKYIPKKEFERMVTRVERERKLKSRKVWGSFCSVTSGNGEDEDFRGGSITDRKSNSEETFKALKVLTDADIQNVMKSIDKPEKLHRIPSSQAPFLAPPVRRLATEPNSELHEREQEKFQLLCGEDSSTSSDVSSVHIVETVFVTEPTTDAKFQVPNLTNDNDGAASARSSLDEQESLQSEMLKLRNEIGNANREYLSGTTLSKASAVDLTHQEKENLENIVDKPEERIICDEYNKFIDKSFDFLSEENFYNIYDEDEVNEAQTLPVVELRQIPHKTNKVTPDDDFTNDNNVWIPQMQNQIIKSGSEHEKSSLKKKRNDEVFPGDASVRIAREVGKLKRDINEKSQVDVTALNSKKEKKHHQRNHDGDSREVRVPLRNEVMHVLGKITKYQEKICQYLDYLREIIEDPPEVEDMNDLKKRQKRASEFSNRFARNHLYQIGRIAEEIRLMPDNLLDIAEKVNSLFQVIMQAIQTYLKNVEMFIYNKYPDKLVVLIDFFINAMKICFDRMVFDKRDLVIQKMMRKCVDMKHYLEMNQQSFAKFASIQDKRKVSLASRNSFAYENPYGSKLSMYENIASTKKPTKSKSKRQTFPQKSPSDAIKPKNFQYSNSKTETKTRTAPSRNNRTQSQANSSKLRRSSSIVSTAVQRIKNSESEEDGEPILEKPFKDFRPISRTVVETPKEMEIMKTLENIAEKKFQEMLGPFLAKQKDIEQTLLKAKKTENEEVSEIVEKPVASSRVTSDISVSRKEKVEQAKKPNSEDEVKRIANNIQYLYVKYDENTIKDVDVEQPQIESNLSKRDSQSSGDHLPEVFSHPEPRMKVVAMKPRPAETFRPNSKFREQLKEQALKDRLKYVEQMMENPLYCNEVHNEPWKMLAGISDKILDELLSEVVNEFDFGEKVFVDKFLQHELQC